MSYNILIIGAGGSPIQNQTIRGIKNSKVSIIIMTKEIDAGPLLG